jgi:ferredoxin like protein
MKDDVLQIKLADKLYRTKYEVDADHPHIRVNDAFCPKCPDKPCTFGCPAEVYKANPNDKRLVTVNHENCLECGTCVQICPLGAIDWKNPAGGKGVKYRFG